MGVYIELTIEKMEGRGKKYLDKKLGKSLRGEPFSGVDIWVTVCPHQQKGMGRR